MLNDHAYKKITLSLSNMSGYDDDVDEDDILAHIAYGMYHNLEEPDPELDPQPDVELEDVDEGIDSDVDVDPDSENFSDIYEIFRIHSSNVERFTSNIGLDRYSIHDSGIYTNAITNYYGHECPMCGLRNLSIEQLGSHLVYSHSRLFVSLTGSLYPDLTAEGMMNVLNAVRGSSSLYMSDDTDDAIDIPTDTNDGIRQLIYSLIFNDELEDVPSYEELLGLCEYIGYHKQGIVDKDMVSVKMIPTEEEGIKRDDTCIVCLETLLSRENIRKIKICGHMFCSECIEKWFEENHTCPLCKTELDYSNVNENAGGGLDDIDI